MIQLTWHGGVVVVSQQELAAQVLHQSEKLTATLGIEERWPVELLEYVVKYVNAETGILFEVDKASGLLRVRDTFGPVSGMMEKEISKIASHQVHNPMDFSRWMFTESAAHHSQLSSLKSVQNGLISKLIIIPLVLVKDEQAVGALYLGSGSDQMLLDEGIERILISLSGHFGELFRIHRSHLALLRQKSDLSESAPAGSEAIVIPGTSNYAQGLERGARILADAPVTLCLIGEAGTGKQELARQLHTCSIRRDKKLIDLNIQFGAKEDHQAYIFGTTKGRPFPGILRELQGGTLVLHHIDHMSRSLQKKIVNVLQSGKAQSIGAKRTYAVDFRLIVSIEGKLEDFDSISSLDPSMKLLLSLYLVHLEVLRNRLEDIPELVDFFVKQANRKFGKSIRHVHPEILDALSRWHWPGNLSELKKEVFDAVLRSPSYRDELRINDLHQRFSTFSLQSIDLLSEEGNTLKQQMEAVEKQIIVARLEATDHNQSLAARQLGLSRQSLINKMNRYGIKSGREEAKKRRELEQTANL